MTLLATFKHISSKNADYGAAEAYLTFEHDAVSYTHLDVYKRQVQSISYSLLCRWFRAAVLPQDKELETALFHRLNAKKCSVCKALFTPGSNRAKYCPECAARMKRINAAKRKRKQREKCHALGDEKPL